MSLFSLTAKLRSTIRTSSPHVSPVFSTAHSQNSTKLAHVTCRLLKLHLLRSIESHGTTVLTALHFLELSSGTEEPVGCLQSLYYSQIPRAGTVDLQRRNRTQTCLQEPYHFCSPGVATCPTSYVFR